MYINPNDSERILLATDKKLLDTVSAFTNLKRSGANYLTNCPKCSGETLNISPAKNVFKCFKCGEVSGKRPIDYLMTAHSMSYPEALKWLSNYFGVVIIEENKREIKVSSKKSSFCARMLKESGLTKEDVIATTYQGDDTRTIFKQPTFVPGTITESGKIDSNGDDVIIHYYNLDGYPQMFLNKYYKRGEKQIPREYYRVRYQFPDEHKDKEGRSAKYKSPAGSSALIYIPEKIRAAYRNKEVIERLFIQEGEKKAEKACKHNIPSIAVAGIQNIGTGGKLPEEIARLVEICKIREIVFILDSDCFDLTQHLKINDPIEKRPRNFFYAIKNYREYMDTLKNRGFYVDVYFGYLLKNEAGDKGVDDLLTNSLKDKENLLSEDINIAINNKDKTGKYIQLHKITTAPENKIQEIWGLQSAEKFCAKYKEILSKLPEFRFGKNKFRYNDNGELESAQPVEKEEQFWSEVEDNKGKISYEFMYERNLQFLKNRGFGRYERGDLITYIKLENKIVSNVKIQHIRDYVIDFCRTFLKEAILDMIHKGGPQYIGDYRLAQLPYIDLIWDNPVKGVDKLYFEDAYWEITQNGISQKPYTSLNHYIWDDQKHKFTPTVLPELFQVNKVESKAQDGTIQSDYIISLTDTGKKCHFLRFLENASNYTWRKEKMISDGISGVTILDGELIDNQNHLVSKLAALGFLAVSYKDPSVCKAVIAMDGRQSEIGQSNGRSGKSLLGNMLKVIKSTVTLDGKRMDDKDNFLWTNIIEKTKVVFIDDVRKSFDFEALFPQITGEWTVNYKGGGRAIFPFESSPKLFITTNHAISGDSGSFTDRQWMIAFSDFYNSDHKPVDDFGCNFFTEWDHEQWNLTWNFVAQCIKLYFQYGVIEAPGERIELRRLRQNIGEEFIQWADEYFSDESHRNISLVRKSLFDNFLESIGNTRAKFYTTITFKSRLRDYCKWKGYLYNPNKYDSLGRCLYYDKDGRAKDDDKRSGIEYFTVGDLDYHTKIGSVDNEDNIFNSPIE